MALAGLCRNQQFLWDASLRAQKNSGSGVLPTGSTYRPSPNLSNSSLFREVACESIPFKAPSVIAQPGVSTTGLGGATSGHHVRGRGRLSRLAQKTPPTCGLSFFKIFMRLCFSCLCSCRTDRQLTLLMSHSSEKSVRIHSFIHSFNECFYQSHILFSFDRYKSRGPGNREIRF